MRASRPATSEPSYVNAGRKPSPRASMESSESGAQIPGGSVDQYFHLYSMAGQWVIEGRRDGQRLLGERGYAGAGVGQAERIGRRRHAVDDARVRLGDDHRRVYNRATMAYRSPQQRARVRRIESVLKRVAPA